MVWGCPGAEAEERSDGGVKTERPAARKAGRHGGAAATIAVIGHGRPRYYDVPEDDGIGICFDTSFFFFFFSHQRNETKLRSDRLVIQWLVPSTSCACAVAVPCSVGAMAQHVFVVQIREELGGSPNRTA